MFFNGGDMKIKNPMDSIFSWHRESFLNYGIFVFISKGAFSVYYLRVLIFHEQSEAISVYISNFDIRIFRQVFSQFGYEYIH